MFGQDPPTLVEASRASADDQKVTEMALREDRLR